MKVILNYDPVSQQITDINGGYIVVWAGLQYEEVNVKEAKQGNAPPESDVVKLSNNGMTAKDLINLRKAGVI